ncbi:MAG: tRNA dihydrouridine synthase DusB [Clostridia bacterium]|nr:tRNA dihydrouridine synthase DusB [Clostridia bacterium]
MENKVILALAPMAGAGDRAFRETCALFGVDLFCTEMISAKAVHFGDKKTALLAETGADERPIAIQLFGPDPDIMAEAAVKLGTKDRCDRIDLNFGCPVPKIVNNGEGSALMKDPALCYEITRAVAAASPLPVTVKIRAGWDGEHLNAPEIAALCEKAGAAGIAVHGRTRVDFYRDGTMRPEVIRAVKEAVSVPVFANGDVTDGESALRLLEKTGCDGLMIGRGAVGSPWVFAEVRAALEGKAAPKIHRMETVRHHIDLAFRYKPVVAGRELRTHMAHYMKGFRGAAALRDKVSHAETKEDYLELMKLLDFSAF